MTQKRPSSYTRPSARTASRLAAYAVFAIAGLALVGWMFDITLLKSIRPEWNSMKVITAFCLLLAAAALLWMHREEPWIRGLCALFGVALCAVAAASIGTYAAVFFTDHEPFWGAAPIAELFLGPTDRMALPTALVFLGLGGALLLLRTGRPWLRGIGHGLLLPVAMISYLVMVGYIFNVPALHEWLGVPVALHTGIALSLLCLGLFWARPDTWLMRVLTGPEAGSMMARRLLPPLLTLPLLVGWLRVYGERKGVFESEVGVALVAATYAACFLFLVWWSSKAANRLQRRAEETLRVSEERFRLLFQQAAVGIKRMDPAGRLLEVNDTLCEILGYSRGEMLRLSLSEITHPDDRAAERAELARLLAREVSSYSMEKRCLRKDGGMIWVRVTSSLPSGSGPVEWWISVVEDITKRKEVEAALQQSERRLRQILDALPVAVFLSDAKGNIIFTNSAVDRIWGISAHVGRDQYGAYGGQWRGTGKPVEPDQWALARTLESGKPFINELAEIPGSGSEPRLIHNFSLPILGDDGRLTGVVVVTEDVTERVHAQEQLRDAKEAAERAAADLARSNKDLEQFAYVASHDLQEPLRAVGGFMSMLRKEYSGKLDAEAHEYIEQAVEGAERMQALINDLLTYSRVGSRGGVMRRVEMKTALEDALTNLRTAIAESGAKVTHGPLPAITADASQMVQLFQNLIGNAIKFHGPRRPEIHVAARQEEGRWLFSVQDNGIGIEPQYYERIFLIFQRLHSRAQYPGTGIGLAVCKRITERHSGTISVESTPGKGTTFHFTLPEKGEDA